MKYDCHFEFFLPNAKWPEIMDLLIKEDFRHKTKYGFTYLRKSVGDTDFGLEFIPDEWKPLGQNKWTRISYKHEILPGFGYMEAEKEEIVSFLKYFLNLAIKENILMKPMQFFYDRSENTWIFLENEEDVDGIFEEKNMGIGRRSQV